MIIIRQEKRGGFHLKCKYKCTLCRYVQCKYTSHVMMMYRTYVTNRKEIDLNERCINRRGVFCVDSMHVIILLIYYTITKYTHDGISKLEPS